jgi:alginate O-acetyltransferase complex protein AlgI
MLFNSVSFFIFFVVVFLTYWVVLKKNLMGQNTFLLIASYFFYGCWDYRFLFLLAFSTWLDYFTGIKIHDAPQKNEKKIWLLASVIINLGFLGLFKYYNFFIGSFESVISLLGFTSHNWTLNIILPVGISFYTFHGLSYVYDIYNNKIKPNRNVIDYSLFVSFFPLLVAGPIERATHLLPQVVKPRVFDYQKAVDGSRQILWGFFKKVVIADNCAPLVNQIFNNYETQSGSFLILGVVLFAFQLYGDFSGYSDISIGVSRLLGFDLIKNFNFPYFAKSMSELWRRWHMSLSTWTNDYIFLPLIKNKGKWGRKGIVYGLVSTFLILGLWHGANWTFICFGLWHGLIVATEYYFQKYIKKIHKAINNKRLTGFFGWFITIILWLVGCIFFRSQTIGQSFQYLSAIVSHPFLPASLATFLNYKYVFFFAGCLLGVEWFNRNRDFGFDIKSISIRPIRWAIYYLLIFLMLRYAGNQQEFIYFQF